MSKNLIQTVLESKFPGVNFMDTYAPRSSPLYPWAGLEVVFNMRNNSIKKPVILFGFDTREEMSKYEFGWMLNEMDKYCFRYIQVPSQPEKIKQLVSELPERLEASWSETQAPLPRQEMEVTLKSFRHECDNWSSSWNTTIKMVAPLNESKITNSHDIEYLTERCKNIKSTLNELLHLYYRFEYNQRPKEKLRSSILSLFEKILLRLEKDNIEYSDPEIALKKISDCVEDVQKISNLLREQEV